MIVIYFPNQDMIEYSYYEYFKGRTWEEFAELYLIEYSYYEYFKYTVVGGHQRLKV